MTPNDNKCANIYQDLVFTVLCVKMRRWMIFIVHLDNDAKESADFRHAGHSTRVAWEKGLRVFVQ